MVMRNMIKIRTQYPMPHLRPNRTHCCGRLNNRLPKTPDRLHIDLLTYFAICLINASRRLTYLSVHRQRQSVSCCSRSSVELSHVTAAPSLSIFCCRHKSHLFSLSYSTFCLFSHLYSVRAMARHF